MDNNSTPDTEPSLLADDLMLYDQYVEASASKRFLNFLIDALIIRFVIAFATGYVLGYLLAYLNPELLYAIVYEEKSLSYYLTLYLLGAFNFVFYYTICEKAFKGVTLGKLLTGTRAIRYDGTDLTFKDALLRSLIRIIPFEVFSGFGTRPWHDEWTNTRVVNK